MGYTVYELICVFLLYAFLGWCAEIVYAAVKEKKFLNRGFLNGPLCPVYGIGMVIILVFFESLEGRFFFLSIGCCVVATLLEFFTGAAMEKLVKRKLWDYSNYRYNLGGYVCLPFSLIWGIGGAALVTFLQPLINSLLRQIPLALIKSLVIAAFILLAIDFLAVSGTILEERLKERQTAGNRTLSDAERQASQAVLSSKPNKTVREITAAMRRLTTRMGNAIFSAIDRRMQKAFPHQSVSETKKEGKGEKTLVFAAGCSFHKLVWLFFISALLGDLAETVFCYFTTGVVMSRSSVVYGPFSIVWGIGVVVLTIMLHRYRDRDDRYIFIFGTVVGGAYEYICSVFTEIVFGTVFWDYSKIPFNLGGRINLLFCLFWGIVSVLWIKLIYPRLSRLIERFPKKAGEALSYGFIVFMVCNMILSGMALARYSDRSAGIPASGQIAMFLDERFPDARMHKIYPNAKLR